MLIDRRLRFAKGPPPEVDIHASEDGSTILSVPVNGGESVTVLGPVDDYMKAIAVTETGIDYPLALKSAHQHLIWFFNFSTRESRPIARVRDPFASLCRLIRSMSCLLTA